MSLDVTSTSTPIQATRTWGDLLTGRDPNDRAHLEQAKRNLASDETAAKRTVEILPAKLIYQIAIEQAGIREKHQLEISAQADAHYKTLEGSIAQVSQALDQQVIITEKARVERDKLIEQKDLAVRKADNLCETSLRTLDESRIQRLQGRNSQEIKALNEEISQERTKINQRHSNSIQQLNTSYDTRIKQLSEAYEKHESYRAALATQKSRAEESLSQLEKVCQSKKANLQRLQVLNRTFTNDNLATLRPSFNLTDLNQQEATISGFITSFFTFGTPPLEGKAREENLVLKEAGYLVERIKQFSCDKIFKLGYEKTVQRDEEIGSKLKKIKEEMDKTKVELATARKSHAEASSEVARCLEDLARLREENQVELNTLKNEQRTRRADFETEVTNANIRAQGDEERASIEKRSSEERASMEEELTTQLSKVTEEQAEAMRQADEQHQEVTATRDTLKENVDKLDAQGKALLEEHNFLVGEARTFRNLKECMNNINLNILENFPKFVSREEFTKSLEEYAIEPIFNLS